MTVEFDPKPLSVLINRETNEEIMTITYGLIINISDLATLNFDIKAIATDDTKRIRMEITGTKMRKRLDTNPPFLLYGNANG